MLTSHNSSAFSPAQATSCTPMSPVTWLPRGMKLQFRMEAINALNYTVLWNPDTNPRNSTFGLVNQDRNNPRDFQLGLRFTF